MDIITAARKSLGLDEESEQVTQTIFKSVLDTGAILFLDQNNEPHITPDGSGAHIIRIDSSAFKTWLVGFAYQKLNHTYSSETINTVIQLLKAKAISEPVVHRLSIRVAKNEQIFWYDLGHACIKIQPNHWEIIGQPPILFRRFQHQMPQAEPVRGGPFSKLIEFLNVKTEEELNLLLVYICACFIPDIAHPVLALFGQHGSSKSTLLRLLKKLIDPSQVETTPAIRKTEQFVQYASHHWAAFFDNLSSLPTEVSDNICRTCTGDGFSKRKFYTDDDDVVYNLKHIIGLNGINNVVTRADLLDRSILIELDRIQPDKMRPESEIITAFEAVRPGLLGAIFDAIAKAMAIKPSVRLEKLPRMADFALWGYAIAEALGIGGQKFMQAYESNINRQNEEAIEASPVATAIIELVKQEPTHILEMTPTLLLHKCNQIAEEIGLDKNNRHLWPQSPDWLWKRLTIVIPNLNAIGIKVLRNRTTRRLIRIEATETFNPTTDPEDVGIDISDIPV